MFVLVTGGSGSGKSAYAESRIVGFQDPKRYYIATMMCFDDESRKRIARHRAMREGKGFTTIERYTHLQELDLSAQDTKETTERPPVDHVCTNDGSGSANAGTSVLLECMSNLTANEMYDPSGHGDASFDAICRGIDSLIKQCDNLVVVTNEIFSDGITYDESTMQYMKLLGDVNTYMAGIADEVVEVVYGIPQSIKR